MTCEEARDQMLAGSGGELEEHLRACAACREEAALWNGLGNLRDEQPGPGLRARFEAMLAAEERRRSWLEGWWPRRPALQFACALAMTALGALAGWGAGRQPARVPELAQLRDEVRNLRETLAVSLLQQPSASERLRGVNSSYRLEQPDDEVTSALLDALVRDPSVDVRLAALDALRRYANGRAVRQGLAGALARPQSPLVQIGLMDALVELREPIAAPALERLARDPAANDTVRQRARWALDQLGAKGVLQ
ncbi:MAG: HEAT repeat domain-containing protein [Acidobacteria bacterium]|nr:HEAT repeat domain-containing protein [Acidobacteriota bacterium]